MTAKRLIQILNITIAVILVLVPFQAFLTTWAGSNFGHLDLFRIWKELILVILTVGSLYLIYTDKKLRQWFLNSRLVILIVIYAGWQLAMALAAVLRHQANGSAVVYGLIINLRFLLFFLVCLALAAKSDWLTKNWRKFILWPAAVVVTFGLLQLLVLPNNFLTHFGYGPDTIPAYQTVDQKPDYIRLQSTLRGPNPLGAYLLVIMTVLIAWLTRKKKLIVTLLSIAAAIVLFYSYSRSAWLGLIISLAVLIYLVLNKSASIKRIGYLALAGLLILVGLVFVFRNNDRVQNTLFHTDENSQSAESSNQSRTQAMVDGAKSVVNEPLGRGVGTAGPASARNNHPARIAENYYIQVGQETGVIGLGLLIAINVYVVIGLWKVRDQELGRIALAALVGLTLVNMLSHAWSDDTLAYVYWGLAGIALASSVILNLPTGQAGKERKHAKT